ncbi:conjugative transfer protein TrbE [alpha proteobacterium U9-1i]|nr:conjugative transfer protein TrbE [alpha proteobacterium U9-1i]
MMDLRPYRSNEARLADWLPWAGLVADGVVVNKDGAFQRTLTFRGPDLDSSTLSELMGASARLDNALKRFGSGWCLHVEARRAPTEHYPRSTWPDSLSWLIDEERAQDFAAAGGRYESAYYLTLSWLPPSEAAGRFESALFEGAAAQAALSIDYRACLQSFIDETEAFKALLDLVMVDVAFLTNAETLTYLHSCVSDRAHAVAVPSTPFHIDDLIADSALVGGLAPKLGDQFLKVLSVRAYVSETEPGLLDALNRLGIAYRWVTRVMPLDREEGRQEIEKIRKRWFSKRKGILTLLREALYREEATLLDNDATAQAEDADLALQQVNGEAAGAAYVTLTITVADEVEARAFERIRQIRQVADGMGFVTALETINAVEAWLGSLPGQPYADLRRPILLTPSLAHLLPLSAVWAGEPNNKHLNGPPLLVAATDGATPFRLNLHHGDVGHTLIVGPTGAGKSVLLGLLAAQWRRYDNAQVFIFDAGRSSRAVTLGLGGAFADLMQDDAGALEVALQPLAHIDNESERAWARDWLIALIGRANITLAPAAREEIWSALGVLASRPAKERTLSVFSALIQDAAIRTALQPFTHAGPWGRLIDADETRLAAHDVQAFETGELLQSADALAAVLPCLVHMLEARFDGRPTLLILDEAWAYLRDPAFAGQIQAWLKTLRKKNVAVVFATQELADVEQSGIAATILEACPTRIFLPNDRAREPRTRAFYESLGLNSRQIALIAEAAPKRDYYVQTRSGARLIDLDLGPAALAFLGASTPQDQRAIDDVLAAGAARLFAAAWLEHRGMADAASALERFSAARAAPPPSPPPSHAESQGALT